MRYEIKVWPHGNSFDYKVKGLDGNGSHDIASGWAWEEEVAHRQAVIAAKAYEAERTATWEPIEV